MAKQKDNKAVIERIEKVIESYDKNDFTIYFFVVDSNNVPNGEMCYIYQMALTLQNEGYNVTMLYQLDNEYTPAELYKLKKKDKEIDQRRIFNGVGKWLGEEYMKIPHLNIQRAEWKVRPSDLLFIPEVFYSLMHETNKHKIPCRRYVILHNYDYITEFIPYGAEWKNFGIFDCITHSETQADLIKKVFPYMNTTIIPPYIPPIFRPSPEPKKLIVTVIAKNQGDVNRIVKPFYWKYPMYKFVTFKDVRNYSEAEMADFLKESPITIWLDENTPFGTSALAAMRCGNIVIGKIPEMVPEWMTDDKGNIKDNGMWVYDIHTIPDLLAHALGEWLQGIPNEKIKKEMEETNKQYTYAAWEENVKREFDNIIDSQIKNLENIKETIIKQEEASKTENNEEK